MTPEEKAKRYDEAFERVKELLSRCRDNRDRRNMVYRVNDIESIFPKEDLIQWISDFPDMIWSGHYKKDVIAWLEKQGEQKQDVNVQINPSEYVNDIGGNGCYLKNATQTSTCSKKEEKVDNQNCVKSVDDIKPKFKVGDWISNDMCDVHIASIENGMYYFDEGDGLSIVFVDEHYHLWTIEDAMDGDVLFHSDSASNGIFIFKEIIDKGFAKEVICYCDYDSEDHFCLGEHHTCCWTDAKILYPATKEQRDTLFAKMKEAGYAFDFEKKELKKLGQPEVTKTSDQEEIAEIPFGAKDSELQEATYFIPKGFHAEIDGDKIIIKKGEKPTAWSEDDERNMQNIDSVLFYDKTLPEDTCIKLRDFLKSLKQRIGG